MYTLPKDFLGFDWSPSDIKRAKERFVPWLHALASAEDGRVTSCEDQHVGHRSFSAFELDGMGLWILHNYWTSVVGAVPSQPSVGFAFAVDVRFVPVEVPDFLRGWGPKVPSAIDLNRELTEEHWQNVTLSDRTYADKFKPTSVSHVLFNYWD